MKKIMQLRNKKGFTLVELIIVIAIIAVLMACVAAFAGPVRRIVKASSASADALQVNKIIGDYIENRLAYASYINVHLAKDAFTDSSSLDGGASGTGFQAIKSKLTTAQAANPNDKSKGGVLIFHYEEDSDEPYKSTYKLYDIPITSSSGSYRGTVFTGTDLNGAVFTDGFYLNNNQILILPEMNVVANRTKNTLLMRLDIYPYSFDTDYYDETAPDADNIYIKKDTLSSYYNTYNTGGKAAAESTVLNPLNVKKTGTVEGIAFQLRNLEQRIKYDDMGNVVTNNWQLAYGGSGSDVIIFYYIPHFGS